jgi:rubrerythrin
MTELSESLFAELRRAFLAEAASTQRYSYFAQIAEIEGRLDVAKLFGELAESLTCVAHGHLDYLKLSGDPVTGGPIGESDQNLAAAMLGELDEASERYPALAEAAHGEGLADVASWFETLGALKRAHVGRIKGVLDALEAEDGAERPAEER